MKQDDHNHSDAKESMVDMMGWSWLALTDLLNPASESESEDEEDKGTASVELSGETRGDSQMDLQVLNDTDTNAMSVDTASVRTYVSVDKESSPPEDRHPIEDGIIGEEGGIASKFNHKSLQGNKGWSENRKQTSLASFFTLSSSTSASKKRRTTSPDSKSDLASRTEEDGRWDKDNGRKQLKSEGKSKLAMASRKLREKFGKGDLEVNEAPLKWWQKKIITEDSDAEFDDKHTFSARHSLCGSFINAKEPYDATWFRDHVKQCSKELRK